MLEGNRDFSKDVYFDRDDDRLPTIALIHISHPTIPHLFQCCFEYLEPWQWAPETELVETGQWFFGDISDDPFSPSFKGRISPRP